MSGTGPAASNAITQAISRFPFVVGIHRSTQNKVGVKNHCAFTMFASSS
jgi:hypothetical protein